MTEYIILAYSESMGAQMTTVGRKKASNARQAVMKYLNEETNRTVQLREGTGNSGYTAVPENNWNSFRTVG